MLVCFFLVTPWKIFWYQNYLGLLKFSVFAFSTPPFSVGETLRVAFKRYKNTLFSVNTCTKHILSRESYLYKNFHECCECVNTYLQSQLDEIDRLAEVNSALSGGSLMLVANLRARALVRSWYSRGKQSIHRNKLIMEGVIILRHCKHQLSVIVLIIKSKM